MALVGYVWKCWGCRATGYDRDAEPRRCPTCGVFGLRHFFTWRAGKADRTMERARVWNAEAE